MKPLWFKIEMDERYFESEEDFADRDAILRMHRCYSYGAVTFRTFETRYNIEIVSRPTITVNGPITTIEFQGIARY